MHPQLRANAQHSQSCLKLPSCLLQGMWGTGSVEGRAWWRKKRCRDAYSQCGPAPSAERLPLGTMYRPNPPGLFLCGVPRAWMTCLVLPSHSPQPQAWLGGLSFPAQSVAGGNTPASSRRLPRLATVSSEPPSATYAGSHFTLPRHALVLLLSTWSTCTAAPGGSLSI